jgi:Carboxypeptidase regulatory-like domain
LKLRRSLTFCGLILCVWGTASAQTQNAYGLIAGIVSDPTGIHQMGATVVLTTERLGEQVSTQLLTDRNGAFSLARLRPGLYSLKVSLAGFMPALQEHILISPNLTTMVHIELGSVFASLDALRQAPPRPSEGDDWQWVLRTSSSTRPVLHVFDPAVQVATVNNSTGEPQAPRPHGRLEMASGSLSPGSSSGLAGPPATAASYDQSIGAAGRVMMAGRMSYAPELGTGATFAGVWLPSGDFDRGPETVVVLRQSPFDSASGQSFRSLRAAHSERMMLGATEIDYGMAYLMAGAGRMRTSLRPSLRISRSLSPVWTISYSMETEPDAHRLTQRGAPLESALDALDTLPVIIWEDGQSKIAGGWHTELAAERKLGSRRSLTAAAFRDSSAHVAVFGFDLGPAGLVNPPIAPYAHDGGSSSSWGSRIVYREKLSDDWEFAAIYAGTGALTAQDVLAAHLSDHLDTTLRHSLAARISGRVPGSHTRIAASYKWINGPVVSRQDIYGEAALGIDPHLSFSVKQPLPSFGKSGHWEAMADFRNVLSQGYVTVDQADGQMLLTPVVRSFRGGVSFQF